MTDRLAAACGFCWTYDEHTEECIMARNTARVMCDGSEAPVHNASVRSDQDAIDLALERGPGFVVLSRESGDFFEAAADLRLKEAT